MLAHTKLKTSSQPKRSSKLPYLKHRPLRKSKADTISRIYGTISSQTSVRELTLVRKLDHIIKSVTGFGGGIGNANKILYS